MSPFAIRPILTRRAKPLGVLVVPASVILAACLGSSAVNAQRSEDRQRAMWVTVVDRDGKPVTGLKPEDFTVREDGVAREVLSVEPATAPIEITVVADTSGAAQRSMDDMRRGLIDFVKEMAKGNHIAITTFGGPPKVVQGYSANPVLLEKGASLFADSGQGGYLLEALLQVSQGIAKRAPERAAIVTLLVRGTPEFSNVDREKVTRSLSDCGAAFDAIVIQTGPNIAAGGVGSDDDVVAATRDRDFVIDTASKATGGINEQALSSLAVGPELKSLAAQLRNQYRLVYGRPESLIPPTKIEVSVKKEGLTARGTPVKVSK